MQSNSDNGMTAAMVAAFANRRPQASEAPSQALMRAYLDKLKELVPMCPKNRSISKLELIQHVIDYINDLQDTLQNGSGDSPPPSPTPDPISFSEAFSQLGFGDPNSSQDPKILSCISHPDAPSSASGYSNTHVYTSDGCSDYDSRGSSPVNSHSDTDCSSDEHPTYNGPGCVQKVFTPMPPHSGYHLQMSHPYYSRNELHLQQRNEPKRHYRRDYSEYSTLYKG